MLQILCSSKVRTVPKPQWIAAWEFRGLNSTIRRRSTIEDLFAQHVPHFRLDNAIAVAFINEVEALLQGAIARAKEKLQSADKSGSAQADRAA